MIKQSEEINSIIHNELGFEYVTFSQHNPSYTIVEFAGFSLLCKNDITPQEFRAKFAESLLDNITDIIAENQARMDRYKKMIKYYNGLYNKYHDIVQKISSGETQTLEPINWTNNKEFG